MTEPTSLPPGLVEELFEACGERRSLDLDRFAELVAPHGLGADAIDAVLGELEARGCVVVANPAVDLRSDLRAVMPVARELAQREGRSPTIAEIAARAGLEPEVVRRALLYGRILGR